MFTARSAPGCRHPEAVREERQVRIVPWTQDFTREDLEALHDYLDAHAHLPSRPEDLSEESIAAQAELLWEDRGREEKERALIVLAHHKSARSFALLRRYVTAADPELERFARFACREALEWLRTLGLVGPADPCPCESGLTFGRCCGGKEP